MTRGVAGDVPGSKRFVSVLGKLRRLKGPIVATAAVGAVLSGLVGYWNVYRTVRDSSMAAATNTVTHANAAALSIVVLPFANLTGDSNQDYFADGLTATLTVDLSQIEGAIVVDSATAQSYKGKPLTAQQIGNALGVRFVLQGSVQRSGPRVRVNAQLADALSNAQLWSDTFERNDADLLALQDRITAKIAASMGREMVNVAAMNSELRRSNPTVTDLLLRARAQSDKPQSLENW